MKQLSKKEIKKFFKHYPKRDKRIVVIMENTQYAVNVANVFRTSDAAGIEKLYLTGISKTPPFGKNLKRASRSKENSVLWEYWDNSVELIQKLKEANFIVVAVEIASDAIPLSELGDLLNEHDNICFLFGNEVYGVVKDTLAICDAAVYMPMYGKGASLNVSTTVGIALYSI